MFSSLVNSSLVKIILIPLENHYPPREFFPGLLVSSTIGYIGPFPSLGSTCNPRT